MVIGEAYLCPVGSILFSFSEAKLLLYDLTSGIFPMKQAQKLVLIDAL